MIGNESIAPVSCLISSSVQPTTKLPRVSNIWRFVKQHTPNFIKNPKLFAQTNGGKFRFNPNLYAVWWVDCFYQRHPVNTLAGRKGLPFFARNLEWPGLECREINTPTSADLNPIHDSVRWALSQRTRMGIKWRDPAIPRLCVCNSLKSSPFDSLTPCI